MKRNTWQRDAVRTALGRTEGFVSAQSLHAAMRDAGAEVGLATVYRALASLATDGEADSLQQDGESLYRACTPGSHHHHLICRRCGATIEIEAEAVETWARAVASQHGYTQPEHVVDVFGYCPACTVERAAPR
ncbi:MAG TPA: transcriptional repressor [Pseudolysinimonas sp.]|nr:transcriptional repressor [Pseudolysinimonas sp.]